MIPSGKFRIKPGSEAFTKSDFVECPAWSEHYDDDELDTIASWGVDRVSVVEQFRCMDGGGSHPNYTILDLERLPHEHMRIFLRAKFQNPTGLRIDGYVVNADAFCIGLFIGEKSILFNLHPLLRSMTQSATIEAEQLIGGVALFPLTYRTDFCDLEGRPIIGVFDPGK